MDILSLVKKEELVEFTSTLNYDYGFMGTKLFPQQKVSDIKLSYARLVEGGNLPVMAQAHALDTEARIGDRVNFETYHLEKAFIKEKLNITERIAEMLGSNPQAKEVIQFIYDDVESLAHRCITRTEVANMELLSTGKVTYKENNISLEIDYNVPESNKISINGWDDPTHDIIADLKMIQQNAKKKGFTLVRAFTSSTMLGYITNNTKVLGYLANTLQVITDEVIRSWIKSQFGVEIVVNDDFYKLSALSTQTYRFFDEQTITFVPTTSSLGQGLFGITPEERLQLQGLSNKGMVTSVSWQQNDPAGIWNKCSCIYVPALTDPNTLFICKHTPTSL